MSIYPRGKIYWYKFTFNGEAIRESTRRHNQRTARDMESAHGASLAKGKWGFATRDLYDACRVLRRPFRTMAKAIVREWFRAQDLARFLPISMRAIRNCRSLASLRLDEVTSERARSLPAYRQSQGLQVSTSTVAFASFIGCCDWLSCRDCIGADDKAATRRA